MPGGHSGPRLRALPGPFDGLVIAAGKIMRGREAGAEKPRQRIARAHPHPLAEMAEGFLGLAVEDQGPGGVAIGGGEVRIEIEGDLEMTHRLRSEEHTSE